MFVPRPSERYGVCPSLSRFQGLPWKAAPPYSGHGSDVQKVKSQFSVVWGFLWSVLWPPFSVCSLHVAPSFHGRRNKRKRVVAPGPGPRCYLVPQALPAHRRTPTTWGLQAAINHDRSRSPRARTSSTSSLPALREDAPFRTSRGRGALPPLATPSERDEALAKLQEDFYSAAHRRTMAWKWQTIVTALGKWPFQPFPPTIDKIMALGAALKMGGYASAEAYLFYYRTSAERKGFAFDTVMNRALGDVLRSCKRGRGGTSKPTPLPLLRLHELDLHRDDPWTAEGPLGPGCAITLGAWFLAREVELSTARAALVELDVDTKGHPLVRWRLPASKNDQEAVGVARAHGCACSGSLASCPWHAAHFQLRRLRARFPERFDGDAPHLDLPLFPDAQGRVVTKDAMTATIRTAAEKLGVRLDAADGSARVSGHSLRVSGAQGLARAGVDTWAIQLLGRWGSATVLEYVQAVPLELSSSWARAAAIRQSLDEKLTQQNLHLPVREGCAAVPVVGVVAEGAALQEALDAERRCASEAEGADVFVLSEGRIWHRATPAGRAGPSQAWSSVCGWRYAGREVQNTSALPRDLCYKNLCARCLPALRAELKQRT